MKISKSARFLSTLLALVMILCSLPFAFGITAAAEGTTLDYSSLEAKDRLHISDYTSLGMHDGAGLHIVNGAVGPESHWYYQESGDSAIEEKGAFAMYDVAPNSTFTATFKETANFSNIKFYVSENMLDWYLADTTVNETTVSATVPYYASYLKIQWKAGWVNNNPYYAEAQDGLVSVNYTQAEIDSNFKSIDYYTVKPASTSSLWYGKPVISSEDSINRGAVDVLNNRGVWASSKLSLTNNGVIVTDYNALAAATTANSYDGHVVYKVQPNTYFGLTVTTPKWADTIAKKLGYADPTDWNIEIYVSPDNVNFTKLDVEPVLSARYGNDQGAVDARRSADFKFIVPDGMAYVKCKLPITQALNSMYLEDGTTPVHGYIGNDIFYIDRVELTRINYDYMNVGTGDYYIEGDLTADTMANFGMSSYYSGVERKDYGIFDTNWDAQVAQGHESQTKIYYETEPNTAFYAGFMINWLNGINAYINANTESSDLVMHLQVWNDSTSLYEDAASVIVTSENVSNLFYGATIPADKNTNGKIRILWPKKMNDSQTGDDCLGLAEVAFTAPKTTTYDFTTCTDITTLTTDYGALSYTAGDGNTVPVVVIMNSGASVGLGLSGSKLESQGHENAFNNGYLTYKVETGKSFKVCFNKNGWYSDVPNWSNEDYTIKVYTSATDTFEAVTEHPITYSDASYKYEIEFDVPAGEEYIKIQYPQTGRQNKSDGTYKSGNDMFRLTSVEISDADLDATAIEASAPAKTEFYKKDALDLTGLEVGIVLNNGEVRRVDNGYSASGYNADTLGEQNITVTYGEFTDTVTVSVYVYDGDLNCDKKVNVLDLIRLKKVEANVAVSDGASADINGDSAVDAGDLGRLSKFLIGAGETV